MAAQPTPTAPAADTFTATFPMARESHHSLRGGARVFSAGFESAKAAREYMMGHWHNVTPVTGSDECAMTCSRESTARDFAAAVEAAGGTVWDVAYLGKGRGFRVECILGRAWVAYFAVHA